MFEVIDTTQNYSHGSFDTLDEAKGAVAFDRLTNWAIYNAAGDIVEQSDDTSKPHSKDSDCTVSEETECCEICGVSHSEECPDCGGRGFHKTVCPVLERSRRNRETR